MIVKKYTVLASEGLHARPAKAFLKLIRNYEASVKIRKDDLECDAKKGILGIISMQALYNSTIILEINGKDEAECYLSLDEFFEHSILNL